MSETPVGKIVVELYPGERRVDMLGEVDPLKFNQIFHAIRSHYMTKYQPRRAAAIKEAAEKAQREKDEAKESYLAELIETFDEGSGDFDACLDLVEEIRKIDPRDEYSRKVFDRIQAERAAAALEDSHDEDSPIEESDPEQNPIDITPEIEDNITKDEEEIEDKE